MLIIHCFTLLVRLGTKTPTLSGHGVSVHVCVCVYVYVCVYTNVCVQVCVCFIKKRTELIFGRLHVSLYIHMLIIYGVMLLARPGTKIPTLAGHVCVCVSLCVYVCACVLCVHVVCVY